MDTNSSGTWTRESDGKPVGSASTVYEASDASFFDGNTFQRIGWRILAILLTGITLGFGWPWATCMLERWESKHTVISGRRLKFEGRGHQLLGRYILWVFLTIITFGIYGIWFGLGVKRWKVKHTVYADDDTREFDSQFTGGAGGWFIQHLLASLITFFTLGIGKAWADKRLECWEAEHTEIGGSSLVFEGTGGQLFVNYLLAGIFSVITFGIYALFFPVKLLKWKYSHTKALYRTERPEEQAADGSNTNASLGADSEHTEQKPLSRPLAVALFSLLGIIPAALVSLVLVYVMFRGAVSHPEHTFFGAKLMEFGLCQVVCIDEVDRNTLEAGDVAVYISLDKGSRLSITRGMVIQTDTDETCVLLSRKKLGGKSTKIEIEIDLNEADRRECIGQATYQEIKDYIWEHHQTKVSHLYIAQIKKKCGLDVGENFNKPKTEGNKVRNCPIEKERMIKEALEYFGMVKR